VPQNFVDFRRIYFRERRPMVGDPMVAAGQGVPTNPRLPHEIPHSQPPGGPTQPTVRPIDPPVTPNTRPLPNQPPPVMPKR
jgi:hypothetical protein